MATLNIKIPDEMESDLEAYIEENPHYLNRSELARDALRHLIGERRVSEAMRDRIRIGREQVEAGETVPLEEL